MAVVSIFSQIRPYVQVLPASRRNRLDRLRWLCRRPQILVGTATYEMAALVTCEFCLDIGSALARATGIAEAQLRDLPRFRDSDAFDADEKLVLELAEAMSGTPVYVPGELRDRLAKRFPPAELTELAATVAWENNRGRLNLALGVRPCGFSEGVACAMAER